ncbi:MAG: D-alanine--D-alanine ligase [Candidatus Sericytochromatia bacterium]|nr:D-alanine--D-alanine ligase [Candidatus Sericytochromatia bacterium]
MAKVRVGVIFGGRSGEHDVSLVSARAIINALDPLRYEVVPIGITRQGAWLRPADAKLALDKGLIDLSDAQHAMLLPEPGHGGLVSIESGLSIDQLDVVFPVLHGPNGEDGTIQGLLELANIPYVGSGVLGSAVGMDKIAMKTILEAQGFPQVDYQLIRKADWLLHADRIVGILLKRFTFPVFIKPANLGSSVGITKARDEAQLRAGIDLAARYDRRVIIEAAVPGVREIECGVLGNDEPMASVLGEIIPGADFYSYEDKYIGNRAKTVLPAELDEDLAHKIRGLAITSFIALDLAGLARVDFFLDDKDNVYINEVNTLPGFTPISMYPKLWEESGLSYEQLVDRLIELALERHAEKSRLETDFVPSQPVA